MKLILVFIIAGIVAGLLAWYISGSLFTACAVYGSIGTMGWLLSCYLHRERGA